MAFKLLVRLHSGKIKHEEWEMLESADRRASYISKQRKTHVVYVTDTESDEVVRTWFEGLAFDGESSASSL